MIHDLKCWPEYFQAVKTGIKPFELRKDDRGYAVGDVLHLREYDPETETYTGDEIDRTVGYILPFPMYGAGNDERYVIMGLAPATNWTPCSEGLPENGLKREDGTPKVYRVTVVDNNGLPIPITYECDATREYDTWITESSYEFEEWETVVAWFELPDPYRGDHIPDAVAALGTDEYFKED